MDRILNRAQCLRQNLDASNLDALLVSSTTNVAYLTGFTGDSSVLLLGRQEDLILSDFRFTTQIAAGMPRSRGLHPAEHADDESGGCSSRPRSLRVRRLGFESAVLSVADFEKLREALPGVALVATAEQVENLRQIKDKEEIAAIREAIEYAEKAYLAVRSAVARGDDGEGSRRPAGIHACGSCGATGSSFPPIVAVGVRSALPHARPTETSRIGDDDFVLLDWGATGRPYKSDLTRVVVTGKVTPEFEKVYRTVLAAQERAIASIRPGVKAHDVDAEARSVIEEAGFGRFFDHGLGHGLGMEIHEAPRLRKESQTILQPGMIVTVEPGIYLPDWGGIRIEDDVLVTSEGCEILTHLPRTLDSVCL